MLTTGGLVTVYVLFFIHLARRRVHIAGVTQHPDEQWMRQIARNETLVDYGFLNGKRHLIHNRDDKYCPAFLAIIKDAGMEPLKLPARSPNLNSVAERWVKSAKVETLCFSQRKLCDERSESTSIITTKNETTSLSAIVYYFQSPPSRKRRERLSAMSVSVGFSSSIPGRLRR